MKSRLVPILALTVLGCSSLGLSHATAAVAPMSVRVSQSRPIVGEIIRVSGAVAPAARPVALQGLRSGRWVTLLSARTGTAGAFGFSVRATATSQVLRAYAPATRIKRTKYAARVSSSVRVTGVKVSLGLSIASAPVGASTTDDADLAALLTPAVARFTPARPGTAVTFQRRLGNTWTNVATAKQDASGVARANVQAGSASAPSTFRALRLASSGVAASTSGWVTPSYTTNVFDDNFRTAASQDRWSTRAQEPGGLRTCARTDPGMVVYTPAAGTVTLRAAKQPVNAKGASACPHGFWHNGMIGTAGATNPFLTSTYGYFAARVKFQSAPWSHGSFWLQAAGDQAADGAEIDVAEYFGDGRPDGGLAHFVHAVRDGATTTAGGIQPSAKSALGSGRTPSNGWHVYSVQWDGSGYTFRVDGVPTLTTSKPLVASGTEELVLSLLTSDWELKQAPSSAASASMQVDWVRAWQ